MTHPHRLPRGWIALAAFLALSIPLAACGGDASADPTTAGDGGTATAEEARLGFFANVTHTPALVGMEEGFFEDSLGETKLTTSTFNAGPEAVEALFADALDVAYIGPNPAINAFTQSNGEAIRIVSGSTSGGAFLVTSPEITSAEDLVGEKVATPQLGNTQDVALRTWLEDEGLTSDTSGGGDVAIVPQANADTLSAFKSGDIAGAWVPEPWATRLIEEGGGKVLVDEATLWPEGRYVTTHIVVRTAFLEEYPGTVRAILEAHQAALALIESDPDRAKTDVNRQIDALTDTPLPDEVLAAAWENLTFTDDPIASSLKTSAEDAEEVGLLEPVDLEGIYSLSILNSLLTEAGKPEVEGL